MVIEPVVLLLMACCPEHYKREKAAGRVEGIRKLVASGQVDAFITALIFAVIAILGQHMDWAISQVDMKFMQDFKLCHKKRIHFKVKYTFYDDTACCFLAVGVSEKK